MIAYSLACFTTGIVVGAAGAILAALWAGRDDIR